MPTLSLREVLDPLSKARVLQLGRDLGLALDHRPHRTRAAGAVSEDMGPEGVYATAVVALRRLRLLVVSLAWLTVCCASTPTPNWVGHGASSVYPEIEYLTGYASAEGAGALDRAKGLAAAELSKRIRLRVTQTMEDYAAETNGREETRLAMATRVSTDLELEGIEYLVHERGGQVHVLAHVRRSTAAAAPRSERDRLLEQLLACGAIEELGTAASARRLQRCRSDADRALEASLLVRAISGVSEAGFEQRWITAKNAVDRLLEKTTTAPAPSLDDLLERLAIKLAPRSWPSDRLTVAPLAFGTTSFSSVFGRRVAALLESQLSRALRGAQGAAVVEGSYAEEGVAVRVNVTVRRADSGANLAGAAVLVRKSAIPDSLPLVPQNLAAAVAQDRVLAEGEKVSGDLRLEVWTNKGEKGLVFEEGEELKLFMRVNRPAYVQITYLLANGLKVSLEQAYYIDGSKVNRAVEYVDSFIVSKPFGVEQLYVVAFSEPPDPLPTNRQIIDGVSYDVVGQIEQLVRHRGLVRRRKSLEVAEALITLTTLPSP